MKKTRKGFTLVELLVVIAIVAILATVAIIGYTSFTKKAEMSNDRTLVAELNKAITKVDGKYESIHEAAEALRAHGFDVSKIEATAKNQEILWDNTSGQFFYTADGTPENAEVWIILSDANKVNGDYSVYYVGTADINSSTVKNLIVYTNNPATNIKVTADIAHVVHVGIAGSMTALKVGPNSYVEKGIVNELNVATTGKVTIYGQVASMTVTAGATVILESGSDLGKMIVNNADVTVDVKADANVGNIASEDANIAANLANKVTGNVAADVVVTEKVDADKLGDFAGGFGTEAFPYLIATPEQLANISKHYDTYNYYKVADGVTSLDLTGVGRIKLHGSFDGNGVSLVNLTTSLFVQVGYQNSVETIKISNLTATLNNTDGHAFVRNIYNAGTTTFENVTLHGYIEGQYNLGSFYNYGTANLGGSDGADYTVEFINSKSDIAIVCTSGNVAAGMLGHAYQGAGNTFTMIMDENSGYTGTIYTTNGKGNMYMAAGSSMTFILNGVETSRTVEYANANRLAVVAPVAGEDGYTVAPVAGAVKFVVSLNTQVTAYDADGAQITNKSGMTWTLGSAEIDATEGKVFDLITSATIVNNSADTMGYTLNNGALTIKSGRTDNYASGTVTLQVAQYDANGNILAVGNLTVYTIPAPSAQ